MNTDELKLPSEALYEVKDIIPFGSRVTCNPPPWGSDYDFLALVEDTFRFEKCVKKYGYTRPLENLYKDKRFASFRKGKINLVITDSLKFFEANVKATEMAKTLNIKNKSDRVAFANIVVDSILGGE